MDITNQEVTNPASKGGTAPFGMNELLMIAYDFPPKGGSGVQRTVKFAKYLAEQGWQSTVVAPQWENGTRDETLESELPESTTVIRQGSGSKSRNRWIAASLKLPGTWRIHRMVKHNFRFPDVASHWVRGAVRAAHQRVLKGGIDVLYSTSPPVTAHLIAMELKTRTGLPWVVDFRDPWTDHRLYGEHLFHWRKKHDQLFERKICHTADVVIANTERNREALIKKHSLASEKVVTIRNGYDDADFVQACPARPNDVFRVCYCGAAYHDYTPKTWAVVLEEFLQREPNADLEWVIAGDACDWARRAITKKPLCEKVRFMGYVTHAKAVELMRSSHLLIQSMPQATGYWVPGKLYEYLRTGTPIAAICEVPSEVSTILKKTQRGRAFGLEDTQGAIDFLYAEYRRWQSQTWSSSIVEQGLIGEFERRQLAGQLAEVLGTISGKSNANLCADS